MAPKVSRDMLAHNHPSLPSPATTHHDKTPHSQAVRRIQRLALCSLYGATLLASLAVYPTETR